MLGKQVNIGQGTDEWLEARAGVITASKVSKCFTSKLAISNAGCDTLAKELASETLGMLSNETPQKFENEAMARGSFLESEAFHIARFELENNAEEIKLHPGSFFENKDMNIACSPDGQVTIGGVIVSGLEVKCPLAKKHLENLLTEGVPSCYYPQIQFSIAMLGVDDWNFMSYYPGAELKMEKCKRDDRFIDKIKQVIEVVNKKSKEYKKVLGI
ncbi:MAG: YqaJ viral recombinase family protein [Mangrovimonas sp.]|nr:YqaJ viral recombinase family protein [Mangrovimonas sp.]